MKNVMRERCPHIFEYLRLTVIRIRDDVIPNTRPLEVPSLRVELLFPLLFFKETTLHMNKILFGFVVAIH